MDLDDMPSADNANTFVTYDYLHGFGKSLMSEFGGKLAETQSAITTALAAQLNAFQSQQSEKQERFRSEIAEQNRGRPALWAAIVGLILTVIMMAGTAFGTLHLQSLRREMDANSNRVSQLESRRIREVDQLATRFEAFQDRYMDRLERDVEFYRSQQ